MEVLCALSALILPLATTTDAAATLPDPVNRMAALRDAVKGEGRQLPEESSVGGQGRNSGVLAQLEARSSTAASLPGVAAVASVAERDVGSIEVAGGAAVISDALVATTASVTDRTWQRYSGRSRYETAVTLSQAGFPGGADVAFLATGENFPDGLAASAAAGVLGGPVLLTTSSGPASPAMVTELARLAPSTTFVAGGPSVIPDAQLEQIRRAVPGMTVTRVYGADRTQTAARLASLVPRQSVAAFVATGADFPDALSGAPAAAQLRAPLLLTARSSLSPAAEAELTRLHAATTYVLGGSDVVAGAVVTRIRQVTGGEVVRLAGANRYETAAAVSSRFFNGLLPKVCLATGLSFADALGAGALAARLGGPLLLVGAGTSPPRATLDEAKRVSWFIPSAGRVIRYVVITHPDDEMSARALLGPPDPRRYDVFVLLTRGETSSYCNGSPVSNPWVTQQFLPQPQPTGLPLSDRCRTHRVDSWTTFLDRAGLAISTSPSRRTGETVVIDGHPIPTPLHLDASGAEVPADFYDLGVGPNSATAVFDLGALQDYEVVWALENARSLREEVSPGAVEGDIIGAGFVNRTAVGSRYEHPDHEALYRTLGSFDFQLPGSQYHAVGHTEEGRTFGAWTRTYCADMCHPSGTAPYVGPMGSFQYSYGWLASGRWSTGQVDAVGGFSEYQSFAKWF